VETQGPLAVIWVAAGLIAFYIALIWINTLLGLFLTPLFIIPLTWLQDKMRKRKARKGQKR
jgi:predicted Na+-dependent transporter